MRHISIYFMVYFLFLSCGGTNSSIPPSEIGSLSRGSIIYSHDLSDAITDFLPSVVEVICMMDYDVEHYVYQIEDGQYIIDATSPTGFRLEPGAGILKDKKNFRAFGGGLIVGWSDREYLILTSRHIVTQEDTVTHYVKENGDDTPIIRTQAFLRRLRFAIRGQQHSYLREARVVADDSRADLALVAVLKRDKVGEAYKGSVIKSFENVWGSLAVIAGYPSEILQIAMGLTSAAPYPGNFSLDVNGTFGYSGGPVFTFDEQKGLSFAGVGRSIPGKHVFHVAPDSTLQFATKLLPSDIYHLQIEEIPVFGAARMYAVDIRFILRFLSDAMLELRKSGFELTEPFEKILSD